MYKEELLSNGRLTRAYEQTYTREIAESYDVFVRESPQLSIPAIPIQNLICASPSEFMEKILEECVPALKRKTPVNHYENKKCFFSINIITMSLVSSV